MGIYAKIKKYRNDIALAIAVVVIITVILIARNELGIFRDREAFQNFIYGFGILGPLVTILIIVAEVIIAPLPGFVPAISAGFIFGTVEGSVYVYIGNIIGSSLVFLVSRKYGRYLLLKLIDEEKLGKYEQAVARHQNILLLLYVFPFIPVDIMSGAFGLSMIRFKRFISFILVAFIAHVLILNYLGDYLARIYFNL